MRGSYIQTKGDRRTRCKTCKCLRPLRCLTNGECPTCANPLRDGTTVPFLATRQVAK